nr:uncharacterized protein LOC103345903 isoform X2 [Oryctolagus cuniculus]
MPRAQPLLRRRVVPRPALSRAALCSTWLSGRAFPEQLLEGESLGKGNSPLGTPRGGPLLFLHPGLPRGGRFRVLLRLRRVPSALEAWALLAPVAATRPLRAHACPLSCLPTALGETPSLAAPPPWPPPALSPLPGDPAPHPHRGLSQGPSPLPARPLSSTLPFLFLQAPCPSAGSWELSPGPDPEPAVAWKPAQSPRRTWRPGLCHGRWPAALRSRLFGGSVGPRCAPSPGASTRCTPQRPRRPAPAPVPARRPAPAPVPARLASSLLLDCCRHCGLRQAAPQRSWGTGFLSRAFVAVDRGTGGSGAPRANHLALPSLRASRLFLQRDKERRIFHPHPFPVSLHSWVPEESPGGRHERGEDLLPGLIPEPAGADAPHGPRALRAHLQQE